MKMKFLSIAATTLVVAACSEQPSTQRGQPASVDEAPARPGKITAIPTASLASFADLAEGTLSRFDAEQLHSIDAPMHCSLDSVNKGAPGAATLAAGGDLMLSGWAQLEGEGAANKLVAVLKGDQSFAFAALRTADRPDLAQQLGKPLISDFIAIVSLVGVPAGEYDVFFVRKDSSGFAKCVADSKVTVD